MNISQSINAELIKTKYYPELPVFDKGWTWMDNFARADINPTNFVPAYLVSIVGGGSAVPNIEGKRVDVDTSNSTNDCVDISMPNTWMSRNPILTDSERIQIKTRIRLSSLSNRQVWFGLIQSTGALTSVPTNTDKYFGVLADSGINNNWHVDSCDGATQTQQDTGVTAFNSYVEFILDWHGSNTVTISVDGTEFEITDIGDMIQGELHWLIKTLTTGAKGLDLQSVQVIQN